MEGDLVCFKKEGCPKVFNSRCYVFRCYVYRTAVSVDGELSDSFFAQVRVHQGSVLSPLLFNCVMDVLSECVKDGSLTELLYADDLLLCGESVEEVMEKYVRWKEALEGKGLKVNVGKTKSMRFKKVAKRK